MKMKSLFVVICACIISFSLCACANENEETKSESVETVESVAETTDEVITKNTAETVEKTGEVENTEEGVSEENTSGPQSVGEWATSLDTTEPKLTIWNDISKEGTLLENGQTVVLKEGDILTLCMKEDESALSINCPLKVDEFRSYGTSYYMCFEFYKEFNSDFLFEFDITIGGIDYTFNVTLISENAVNSPDAAQEEILSGKEWAATLEFDEPKLLVWNDETGTREVIDEGGEYHMQEGDVLAAYYGDIEKCILVRVEPFDFCPELTFFGNCDRMEYVLPEESQTINLGLEFCDFSRNEFFTYYFTITTP